MPEENEDQPSNVMTRQAALVTMLFTSPVIITFAVLGRFDQGIGAWICAGIVVHSIRIHWGLRKNPWFWMAIVVAFFLQLPFIAFVPWTRRNMSMMSLLPVGVLDYFIVRWCIQLADKVGKRRLSPPSGS